MVIVNKSDGPLKDLARKTASDYRNAIHLSGYESIYFDEIPVNIISCETGEGIGEVVHCLNKSFVDPVQNTLKLKLRKEQEQRWLKDQVKRYLIQKILNDPEIKSMLDISTSGENNEIFTFENLLLIFDTLDKKYGSI